MADERYGRHAAAVVDLQTYQCIGIAANPIEAQPLVQLLNQQAARVAELTAELREARDSLASFTDPEQFGVGEALARLDAVLGKGA